MDQVHRATPALDHLAGIVQFAMSPCAETCIAPGSPRSIFAARIIPNDVAESKTDAPRRSVTVSFRH